MPPPRTPNPMGWRGLPQARPRRPNESERQKQVELARRRSLRTSMLMALATALTLIMGYRLFYWQVLQRDELLARAAKPTLEQANLYPRGTIRDRNGYLLATDSVSYKFGVSPKIVSYPQRTAQVVSEITGMAAAPLEEIFLRDDPYYVVTDTLPYTIGQQLVGLNEPFFRLDPTLTRSYPEGPLAAHLLGFVNAERRGLAGIEMYYDALLKGEEAVTLPDTPPAEEIKLGNRPFTPTQNGVDLVLTLDRSIQFMAEQELETAIQAYEALGGTIIVMEPHTGDILAMASSPTYEPNRFGDYLANPDVFQNPAVSKQYEPGSIFKMLTVAAALDAGIVAPEAVFNDPGIFEVGGRLVRNWDGRAYGARTITEILGYSLNTGTAWLSTSLGPERFYSYLDAFGFGEQTGIDLGSEAAGMMKKPPEMLPDPSIAAWHPSDLGTNAFGQGIAVTPIQMIAAAASLLNDGQLMQPRVVKAVIAHGHLQEQPVQVRGQTVSAAVAQRMQQMLADAVEIETETALIEGWRIGGKTGTAQVPIPGGYHATDTIASFIGFAPADDPAFIVLVKLERPLGIYQWGSQSAARVWNQLARRVLNYYNIPPDAHRMARPAAPTTIPASEPSVLNGAP